MKKDTKIIIAILIFILLVICGSFYFRGNGKAPQIIGGDTDIHGCLGPAGYSWCEAKATCIRPWESFCTSATAKIVTFTCDASKSIVATFYPTDDKFVDLKLSDGRDMSVPHAISASGARYAKPDESFVFWNKGDTAFVTEGESGSQTYSNCVLVTK
jgi:membrane-bound inhibitor of C-type lysozyme